MNELKKAAIKGLSVTCHAFYKTCTNPAISELLESAGLVEFVDVK